jgi:hypothetical protein
MPIVARCPNPTCGQTLQVPDQYAGMQGKCPTCGTMVTFQPDPTAAAPAPAAAPAAAAYTPPAAPDAYTAQAPAAPGAYPPPPVVGQVPAPPGGPPMSPQELVQLICVPAGLFFLFLLIICTFLPWGPPKFIRGIVFFAEAARSAQVPNFSGIHLFDAGFFMVLCLLLGAVGSLTYLFKWLLPTVAAVGAGFGIFAVFFLLGAITDYGGTARVGIWLGLVAAIGTAGSFVTLAIFRPVESPTLQSLNLPLMKPYGGLVIAGVFGAGCGVLYLILAAIS